MRISLPPVLDDQVLQKVESGLYNIASEVICEALRLMIIHEELALRLKIDAQ